MSALQLFKKHKKAELLKLSNDVEQGPKNQAAPGSLFRFNPDARKKLADIAQAIAWHMEEERAAAGNPVSTCGYSGRKSNRRA